MLLKQIGLKYRKFATLVPFQDFLSSVSVRININCLRQYSTSLQPNKVNLMIMLSFSYIETYHVISEPCFNKGTNSN